MADDDRSRVRAAVTAEMAHRGWNIADLASGAKVDPGTISDFLSGERWPQIRTLGRVERALAWPAGAVARMLNGGAAPAVGGSTDDPEEPDDELLYRRPDGLSDAEWDQVKRESREFIEWQIEKASRER